MSWDPPAALSSIPLAQTSVENQFHHYAGSEHPSSHLPLQRQTDVANNISNHTSHPRDLSFLGSLTPSHDQAVQDFNTWNRSAQGGFPLQPLGPGHAGPSSPPLPDRHLPSTSHKRKRTPSLDSAAVGGYGPMPGTPDEQTEPSTPDLSPTIKFNERKNSAYEVWVFTRAVETDRVIPPGEWPDDYNDHLTKRPVVPFIGCKFCTQFGYPVYLFSNSITHHSTQKYKQQ